MNSSANPGSVLIIADDAEFARTVMGRWQTERHVPSFTLLSSELWNGTRSAAYHLAIVGPVGQGRLMPLLKGLEASSAPAVCVTGDGAWQAVRAAHPRILALRQHDDWLDALILLCGEVLRRVEAAARATRAERAAAASQRHATLGRYMIEMRHSFNNALTSVLGNAELLLLEPGALSAQAREQIDTIHNMSLRMHEIMQRFSSLESEMLFAERQSHGERKDLAHAYVAGD